MREIIFRGKDKDTGKWVFGSLIQANDGVFIFDNDCHAMPSEPEYHEQGMGCGLEDRNITDRYEAMQHGWDCALEKMFQEELPIITEVDPKTIGQFTGLLDENGVKVFEGDRCKIKLTDDLRGMYGVIAWVTACWDHADTGFFFDNDDENYPHVKIWFTSCCEVVGNIHSEANKDA